MNSSFVDFYKSLGISPVSQNLDNLYQHFRRREHLYYSCGIWPESIEGKSVIEFGPGGGHNALYTASLKPASYKLVEGNPVAVEQIRRFVNNNQLSKSVEICNSLFEEIFPDERFDLVIAEGCVPHQQDPVKVLQHIARFVKPGGLLLTTAISSSSYLSEICRRLVPNIMGTDHRDSEAVLRKFFAFYDRNLQRLTSRTRPTRDWILDNIVQDLENRSLFGMNDVLSALETDFTIIGTSPCIGLYKNWYKEYSRDSESSVTAREAREAISGAEVALLDYRLNNYSLPLDMAETIKDCSESIWSLMKSIQNGIAAPEDLFPIFERLEGLLQSVSPITLPSVQSFSHFIRCKSLDVLLRNGGLVDWWGRGQQYVTLRRNPIWYKPLKLHKKAEFSRP